MKRLENRAENHEKKDMEKGNQLRLVPTLEVVNSSICFYFKNFEGLFTLLDSVSKPAWFSSHVGLFHQQTYDKCQFLRDFEQSG